MRGQAEDDSRQTLENGFAALRMLAAQRVLLRSTSVAVTDGLVKIECTVHGITTCPTKTHTHTRISAAPADVVRSLTVTARRPAQCLRWRHRRATPSRASWPSATGGPPACPATGGPLAVFSEVFD
jgi:hypothetical protein